LNKLSSPRGTIRQCDSKDIDTIFEVINEASKAYKPVLPSDAYHEPQMPLEEVQREIRRVRFLVYEEEGRILGVMGYEYLGEVALIRHAYVRSRAQRKGIGTLLLTHIENSIIQSKTVRKIVIGTYSGASWAISFYEKHGYQKSSNPQEILTKYYDIPEVQRLNSLTLEKTWA
jgi:GNAT superfamily N-acetyltransferase